MFGNFLPAVLNLSEPQAGIPALGSKGASNVGMARRLFFDLVQIFLDVTERG
jgi:hypothetical protein